MVGPFIALDEADPTGRSLAVDDVDAGDLRFLAAVRGEGGDVERLVRSPQDSGVALVKPLRGSAALSRRGPPSRQTELEHFSRIRRWFGEPGCVSARSSFFFVHLVTLVDTSDVRQTRSGDEQTGLRIEARLLADGASHFSCCQ